MKLLEQAAARGFRQADLELGHILADGAGIRKDPLRALCHFILAGDIAADAADALAGRMTDDVIAVARAQAHAIRSARKRGRAMAGAFCVLSTPGTGSTTLCSLLNSHPEIYCHQELFDRLDVQAVPVAPVALDREAREREPLRWLDAVVAASYVHDPGWKAIGFKLHLLQRPSVLERILFEPGFAILLLDRADRLAHYAARKLVDRTRLSQPTAAEPEPLPRVRFEAEEFATFVRQQEDLYRMVRTVARGLAVFELDDAELFDPEAHRRILAFLGVAPEARLTAPERKPNPVDVLARFTNPDDVVAALGSTRPGRSRHDGQ
jgi:hypothetical protein